MTGYHLIPLLLIPMLLLSSCALATTVNINDSFKDINTVVYYIPNDEGKADAIRYVGEIHDKFFSKLEMIDAEKLDDSTLEDRLKDNFVLYTTIGSKLFNAATQPLHIQISGDTLSWNGVTAPVNELRLILIGKNPYGDGKCTIYAAGTNNSLVGINSCLHGPCSYHIFQGKKLLKEGKYDENFIVKGDRLSQAEAAEDVHQFFSTMQRVHPNLLAKMSLDQYIELKKQTMDDINKKMDSAGTIGINDLAYILFYAAASFHDGHTQVQWWFTPNELNTTGILFPPFLLGYDNGRFIITASNDKSLDGLELISVNGKPILKYLSPILDRCSGEILAFKTQRFTGNQLFWYTFTNLCGSGKFLALRLRDTRGKNSDKNVETVSFADAKKINPNKVESKLEQLRQKGTQVYFLDSDKVAYFVYPSFNYNDEEKKKVDSIFKTIKEKKSQDLIIDIRGNSGGNSNMGNLIFSYIYDGKFTPFSKMIVRLSSDVLSSVAKDWDISRDADIDGLVCTWDSKEKSVPKPDAFFSGRAFLLVDNGTFSSATDFTTMFRDYKVGPILGYETGGLPICFGDIYPFHLKNSGIGCGVSWKQFFNPKPRPGDDEHGVIPDIPMNDKLLKAYQKEDDPVLAYTLDYIKKTHDRR